MDRYIITLLIIGIILLGLIVYKIVSYKLEKRKIDEILKYIDTKSKKDKDIAKNIKLCLDIIKENQN